LARTVTQVKALLPLCPTTDVPDGQGLQVAVDDMQVAVFKVGDRYRVIDDHCTHGPGLLSEGEVTGEIVECEFHHGAFNICTGQVVAPPCMVPIRTYYTEVREGQIYIDRDRPAEP
jgi:nitrite reductase/ring-hydroxylating ferredoxin subunit